jgi:hypothetical protein
MTDLRSFALIAYEPENIENTLCWLMQNTDAPDEKTATSAYEYLLDGDIENAQNSLFQLSEQVSSDNFSQGGGALSPLMIGGISAGVLLLLIAIVIYVRGRNKQTNIDIFRQEWEESRKLIDNTTPEYTVPGFEPVLETIEEIESSLQTGGSNPYGVITGKTKKSKPYGFVPGGEIPEGYKKKSSEYGVIPGDIKHSTGHYGKIPKGAPREKFVPKRPSGVPPPGLQAIKSQYGPLPKLESDRLRKPPRRAPPKVPSESPYGSIPKGQPKQKFTPRRPPGNPPPKVPSKSPYGSIPKGL